MKKQIMALMSGVVISLGFSPAIASPPPSLDPDSQGAEYEISEEISNYVIRNGFRTRVATKKLIRDHLRRTKEDDEPTFGAPPIKRATAVNGTVEIPVLPFLFSDSAKAPFSSSVLETHLYGNAPGDRSITTHYNDMSRGLLNLTGEVRPWVRSKYNRKETNSDLGQTLTEILTENDKKVNFAQFDNDGPDGKPNSGDDDGIVDFIAFVQPNIGNECGKSSGDIHSHKYNLKYYKEGVFETNDKSKLKDSDGIHRNIRIAEYLINPALSCDKKSIIEIGVFTHEYGHAFALPDLYNTNNPRVSSGISNWGLMGAGSWGGDYVSPDRPTHMLAWSKEYLGWVQPLEISNDVSNVKLRPVTTGDVIRINYSDVHDPGDQKYLLLTYRTKDGFDDSLPASGLLMTEIHDVVIAAGMMTNQVNSIANLHGINVIPANGVLDLHRPSTVAHRDHLFTPSVHGNELPESAAQRLGVVLCNIREEDSALLLDIFFDETSCPSTDGEPIFGSPGASETTSDTFSTIISSLLKEASE
ncbi:M6 family metalloprotease domain-containing protein [Hellea sp.]|nr:M6 family metalloprotease domain-containing protein [Hellea sp.]